MTSRMTRSLLSFLLLVLVGFATTIQDEPTRKADEPREAMGLRVHFLEIVTSDLDAACAVYAKLHGVKFSDPVPEFGNARTASLANGGTISVRAPMRADEDPVVRPYMLVDDIEAAARAAEAAGAKIAHPPWEIPGHGMFAIYILGGNDQGLWQL